MLSSDGVLTERDRVTIEFQSASLAIMWYSGLAGRIALAKVAGFLPIIIRQILRDVSAVNSAHFAEYVTH